MSIEKISIEMQFDPEDPEWIFFDFDGLNGTSGNDPVDEFIEYTLPEAIKRYVDDAIKFRGK